jgi:hypothetical protein
MIALACWLRDYLSLKVNLIKFQDDGQGSNACVFPIDHRDSPTFAGQPRKCRAMSAAHDYFYFIGQPKGKN